MMLKFLAGEDYSGVDQQLTFTMDEGRRCVNITLLEEDVLETTEIMFLDLQSEDPAVILSPAQASVFITDTSRKYRIPGCMVALGNQQKTYIVWQCYNSLRVWSH